MRKHRVILAAVSLSALAIVASALAAGGVVASASGGYGFTGSAAGSFFDVKPFAWTVQIHADGSASGHYNYTQVRDGVSLTVKGPLTCATIIGNRVWVGGLIAESDRPSLIGLDMWFQAQDNGTGPTQQPDMSSTVGAGPAGAAQQYCDDHPDVRFPFLVEQGDLQVRGG